MRLLAYYMARLGDTSLAEVLADPESDMHAESAKGVFLLDTEPTDAQRQLGKNLNFSMVYGGGKPAVLRYIKEYNAKGGSAPETWEYAGVVLKNFHRRWPGIQLVIRMLDEVCETRGYITTPWGRHLRPESPHKRLNAIVQGSAADLMRNALITTWERLRELKLEAHLVSVIHDELIVDTPKVEIPLLKKSIPQWMDWKEISEVVPIETDMEWTTSNWAEKAPYVEENIEQ